jgi:putative transposase
MQDQSAYEELGLDPNASDDQIKATWRRLVAAWHPDRNVASDAGKRMQQINKAYQHIRQLRDVGRSALDDAEENAPAAATAPASASAEPGTAGDIHVRKVRLTSEDAILGCTRTVRGHFTSTCKACVGTGQRVLAKACSTCGGSGAVRKASLFGWLWSEESCADCGGDGRLRSTCEPCDGNGEQQVAYRRQVRFPAGVRQGHVLSLPRSRHDGVEIGLELEVEIEAHPLFVLDDDSVLRCDMPVNGYAWMAERWVEVPTPDGMQQMRLSRDALVYRLRGQGFPSVPRGPRGDYLVKLIPVFPQNDDAAQEGGCKKFCVNGFWQETAVLHGAMITVDMKPLPTELIDALLADYKKPEDLIGQNGLLKQLTKALVERALQAEMTDHLGHGKNQLVANEAGNTRNGRSKKTLKGDFGELPIEIPRDRAGTFEPQLIGKHQTRWSGFDDKILSLYARGMTVREIQSHLQEMYGVEVSPTLISSVTDAVMDEVKAWQSRPLDALYPIVYMDCIHVKVRDNGAVRVKALYLAIGVNLDGMKEVLGLWMAQTEGAKFWLQVVTELKNRGAADIFIACVDGLKGFPDAIEAVFPKTAVQLCLVHMVRHSLNFVGWKQRKEVAADLRLIYAAPTESEAERQLTAFEAKWDNSFAPIGQSWRRNWARLTPFFDYPPDIRKVIYTTNAIESVNMSLRKITKTRGSFPTDDAVFKLFYLALNNISQKWTMPIRDWKAALNRFTIQFDERMPRV